MVKIIKKKFENYFNCFQIKDIIILKDHLIDIYS
jgi:hypothetical protein